MDELMRWTASDPSTVKSPFLVYYALEAIEYFSLLFGSIKGTLDEWGYFSLLQLSHALFRL
jgi:hypothetical protein